MDDATLIQRALAGRREDFDLLVERHQRPLYAFVYRIVGDHELTADIVQAAFLRAYSRLAQFEQRSSFATWLHQIALNECRMQQRSRQQRREVPLDVADATATPAAEDASAGWRHKMQELVARLPPRQRNVVSLRVFGDLSFKSIAEAEGISENAAKVNYHHAIVRLREWLKEAAS